MALGGEAQWGIVTTANDRFLPWLSVLLSSTRATNPDLPIVVLPFADDLAETRRLAAKFGADVNEDPGVVERSRDLGRRVHGTETQAWRLYVRFGAVDLPFRSFLYLDSDVMVTRDLSSLLDGLSAAGPGLYFTDVNPDAVYTAAADRDLVRRSHLFNAGVFASVDGALRYDDLLETAEHVATTGFELPMRDQSFLNLTVDRHDIHAAQMGRVDPTLTYGSWAGRIRTTSAYGATYDWPPIVHWAGFTLGPAMPLASIALPHVARGLGARSLASTLSSRASLSATRNALRNGLARGRSIGRNFTG